MINFLVIDFRLVYNIIIDQLILNLIRAIISTYHLKIKFPTKYGIKVVCCDKNALRQCYAFNFRAKVDYYRDFANCDRKASID